MRRIYATVFGSSLISAALFSLIVFLFAGSAFGMDPRRIALVFAAVFLSIWLGFLICRLAIRRHHTPGIWMATGVGSIIGALSLFLTYFAAGNLPVLLGYAPDFPHPVPIVTILTGLIGIFLMGGLIGLLLGIVNFVVWSRFGVISQLVVRQVQGR